MNINKILTITFVSAIGIIAWIALAPIVKDVITTVNNSIVDSTSTEVVVDSMKVVKYVYTDDYKLHKNGVIKINGSNYRYIGDYNVIGNYDKELFKITGSDAEVHPGT